MGLLILAVLGFAGLWLLLLARRGRRVARQQPKVTPVIAHAPLQTSATTSAADDLQRADPWLKMSELERAIGGRFDLPDLDMGAPQSASTPAAAPARSPDIASRRQASPPLEGELNPQAARPPEIALNQQLARSLELAAACLRRNEVDRARRLLEDVVRSGDETRREFARALLSRLG
jgi:FimV-like protein